MKNWIILLSLFMVLSSNAQKSEGFSYGIQGGIQLTSAILPELKLNPDLNSILRGDDVVKGVPQLADFRVNYKLGIFAKYEDGFGFTMLETNYTSTKIYKDFSINSGSQYFPQINYYTLDIEYSYFDIALSYNIFLTKKVYFTLGANPAFLISNSGNIAPEKVDFRIFSGFGLKLENNMSISIRAELGVSEVYKDSYIHHVMLPITFAIPL